MAVALDHKGFCHFDAARLGNAANVVTRQVDEHDVLGALLGVVEEFLLDGAISLFRGAARARARQRADGDFLSLGHVLVPHQNFGRRTHHLKVAEVVVVHVRAGVERTQRAIQVQRVRGKALAQTLAHLHLHEVARSDQLLGARHGLQIVFLGKAALHRLAFESARGRRHGWLAQALVQLAQAALAVAVGFGPGGVHINQQVQLAREVVDHSQLFALQQQDVGRADCIGRACCLQPFLDMAYRVVAEVTRQPAAKTRQARHQRHLESLLVRHDEVQRIAVRGFLHHAIGHHFGSGLAAKTAGTQQGVRGQPDEAVAPEALAPHYRLEQKAVPAAIFGMRELEVEGKRRFQIGKGLQHQRNAVVALRGQMVEFDFGHHESSLPVTRAVRMQALQRMAHCRINQQPRRKTACPINPAQQDFARGRFRRLRQSRPEAACCPKKAAAGTTTIGAAATQAATQRARISPARAMLPGQIDLW